MGFESDSVRIRIPALNCAWNLEVEVAGRTRFPNTKPQNSQPLPLSLLSKEYIICLFLHFLFLIIFFVIYCFVFCLFVSKSDSMGGKK